jgi:hypothetical protein
MVDRRAESNPLIAPAGDPYRRSLLCRDRTDAPDFGADLMARRGALVSQVLERVSGVIFDRYPALVRAYALGQAGVYALYKKDRLYYVGLASDLRGRLNRHLRDRHRGRWNLFSLYLVRDRDHIKDLETLLLRIAHPRGNSQVGRFVQYEDLRRELKADVRLEQDREKRDLLGLGAREDQRAPRRGRRGRHRRDDPPALAPYLRRMTRRRLRAVHRGRVFTARVLRDGRISVKGKRFTSPSTAGSKVLRRSCNGWVFWRYERGQDNWRPLNELR